MAELLLELLSEEIPARMQVQAGRDLARLVDKELQALGLQASGIDSFTGPRRLCLRIAELATRQEDRVEERRGPRADAPDKAVQGFLRSVGLDRDACEIRETEKGAFLFAVIRHSGKETAAILAPALEAAIKALAWPKSMCWGDGDTRWVRPLHNILCLFDGAVIPLHFAGIAANDKTCGHRIHAPDAIAVRDFSDYKEKLRAAHVLIDAAERRQLIAEAAAKLAAQAQAHLVEDDALIAEIAGLVEWPVPLLGRLDTKLIELPAEIPILSMRTHQRYLSLKAADGRLAPCFIAVANLETADQGQAVIAGNERVLRARLADAAFFWQSDLKKGLAAHGEGLGDMVFHAKLGSLADKEGRICRLARLLAEAIPAADPDLAAQAARLAKADLLTEMVGEFPELQGVIGGYYATAAGEPDAVATAIAQHYAPQGPDDTCPAAPVSIAVALADKLDTLAGFFAIDERPTGSRDPYGLRRAALGCIRLIIENKLRLRLSSLFAMALEGYSPTVTADTSKDALSAQLLQFFADRLNVYLRGQGVRHDHIDAIFSLDNEDDLVRLLAKVAALGDFLGQEEGQNLLAGYRRAVNILRIEEKRDRRRYDGAVAPALFQETAEKSLYQALNDAATAQQKAMESEDFVAAMAVMAGLRGAIDDFFDHVTVNAETEAWRENRLNLLSHIRSILHMVADFSKVEG